MTGQHRAMLLDGAAVSPVDDATVLHWRETDVPADHLSVPRLVEEQWSPLRATYLAWIQALGETTVAGGSIKAHLSLGDGLSFWWMTLMAEKSPMKTRTVHTAFKLRALELWCDENGIDALTYAGRDRRLDWVLSNWCRATNRHYRRQDVASDEGNGHTVLGQRVRWLPHPLRGLAWLAWTWWTRVRPVRRRTNTADAGTQQPQAALVSYFPNCDLQQLTAGRFRSNIWQDLHGLLDRMAGPVHWIWLFVPTTQVSLSDALTYRDGCNAGSSNQRFFLLEEFVSPRTMIGALSRFLTLVARSRTLLRNGPNFRMPGSRLNLYPVVLEDWRTSLTGIVAAEAAFYAAAFGAMAESLPAPERGLYVYENQPWEQALVAAWKAHGVTQVVAHQHEAVKPLNFRLFDDPHCFDDRSAIARPRPDILATGSDQAAAAFLEAGFPKDTVRVVESLRFRNAAPVASERTSAGKIFLVVTGYLTEETRHMLALTAAADAKGALAGYAGIVIKPHPFLPVDTFLQPLSFRSEVTVVETPLPVLTQKAGYAFLANSTAAIYDTMAAEVPSAVCGPQDDFNFSPALEMASVPMIFSADELVAALEMPRRPTDSLPDFCTDPALSRWAALLGQGEAVAADDSRPRSAVRGAS